MMTGDTVHDGGVTFEVIWDGAWNAPSLLSNYPRPSALADLVPDRRQLAGRGHVSARRRDAQLMGRKRDRRKRAGATV